MHFTGQEDLVIVRVDFKASGGLFAMHLLHEDIRHAVAVQVEEGRGVRSRHDVTLMRLHAVLIVGWVDEEVLKVTQVEPLANVVLSNEHLNLSAVL